MAYGNEYQPIASDQITTPQVNVQTYINEEDLTLWGKFPDGSVKPLYGVGSQTPGISAVNTGTSNAIIATIDGVNAYTAGDIYYIYTPTANTGNVIININDLGLKSVRYKGQLLTQLPAGLLEAGKVHALIYNGNQFIYVGTVNGNMVKLSFAIGYAEAATIGLATATATFALAYLPPKSLVIASVLHPTAAITGATISAADLEVYNAESGLYLFNGAVDTFAAPAADKGGISTGFTDNVDVPYQAGTQTYVAEWVLTGGVWNDAVTGAVQFDLVWMPF